MSAWRADLAANGRAPTWRQATVAWLANPGFALACHYRLAHWAVDRGRGGRFGALWLERRMIAAFACHLSARARIGPGVRFPHPLGIVIGEDVEIGPGATIYQQVTIGRRLASDARYPRVGAGVTLYAGAMLLGAVDLGDGAVVGAQQRIMAGTA